MKVTYEFEEQEHNKVCKRYFEQTAKGKDAMKMFLFAFWWGIVYVFLIFAILIGHDYGAFPAIVFFAACNIFYLVLAKRQFLCWAAKWYARKTCRHADKTTVILSKENAVWRTENTLRSYKWKALKNVQKLTNAILFEAPTQQVLVPRYAFGSDEDFGKFCELAGQYYEDHQEEEAVGGEKEKEPIGRGSRIFLAVGPGVLGLIILLLAMYLGTGH